MGWFWNRNDEQDSGETEGWGDLTDQELSLMNEADAAQGNLPLDDRTFYHAIPSEGAVYISQAEGNDYNCMFSFTGGDESAIVTEGNDTLLSYLNGNWDK
jgi:hypothetical protein